MEHDYSYDNVGESLLEQVKNTMREEVNSYISQPEFLNQSATKNKYSLQSLSETRIQALLNSLEGF